MQVTHLTTAQQTIFDSFRARFNDIVYFDRLLQEPIRRTIVDIHSRVVSLNPTSAKMFSNKYICARKMTSTEDKALSVPINHIICTLCIFMIRLDSPNTANESSEASKLAELKNLIADFDQCDDSERNLLVTFYDVVKVAVIYFPGTLNKARVLFIGHRLGGSNLNMMSYATGGGQSTQTERRVRIYEHLSGVTPANRTSAVVSAPVATKRARDVIEISPPPPDASEDLIRQYQETMAMIAQYQEAFSRRVVQRTHSPTPQDLPVAPDRPVHDHRVVVRPVCLVLTADTPAVPAEPAPAAASLMLPPVGPPRPAPILNKKQMPSFAPTELPVQAYLSEGQRGGNASDLPYEISALTSDDGAEAEPSALDDVQVEEEAVQEEIEEEQEEEGVVEEDIYTGLDSTSIENMSFASLSFGGRAFDAASLGGSTFASTFEDLLTEASRRLC